MNLSLPCPRCSQSGATGKVAHHETIIDRSHVLDSPGVILGETPGSFWWCDECHEVFLTRCESPLVLQSPDAGPLYQWDVDAQTWRPVADEWTL
ncbi:MAG TPA: hypothetical protein PKO09_17870 [Anaerolineae bacterium]|nr:hypothetical protein [Anaerolineae bacterium]